MLNLKEFKTEPYDFAGLLNYAFFVDDGIMLQKDGSFCACFEYRASDIFSAAPSERNQTMQRVNNFLVKFGSGWAIQFDSVRERANGYGLREHSHFPDPITGFIDEERENFFNDAQLYKNETFVTLTYYPPSKAKSKIASMVFEDDGSNGKANDTLTYFNAKLEEFLSFSSTAFLKIRQLKSEEMLGFLNTCISGKTHPVRHPYPTMYLDAVLSRNFATGVVPKVDDMYMQVVAIEGYPMTSYPNILDALSHLQLNVRWNTKFVFMDNHEALERLEKIRRRWKQKEQSFFAAMFNPASTKRDEHAMRMVAQTDAAISDANSGALVHGYHTTNFVIFSDDRDEVEQQAAEVRRIIEAQGFDARIEEINPVAAYLGSLPGNITPNVRRDIVGSMSLTHLLPLSTTWQGNPHNENDLFPPHSPALMKVVSGSTPFYLNLHVRDVGHTLVFGPTGAGKSTLLATMVAQARRYRNAKIFAFDKDMSLYALTSAAGGDHYELGSDSGTLAFAPFSNLHGDSDFAWAESYLQMLVELQGVKPTSAQKDLMNAALRLHQQKGYSSLTDLVSNIQDSDIRQALKHYTIAGSMGRLLDAEKDNLSLSTFSTFEINDLMNMKTEDSLPVLLYLFRKIEKSLDGSPTWLFLDEAWILLGHPVFKEKIRDWLKTLRKKNCAVIIATQSLSDAASSGILDVLQESCPTKILLPNPEAWNEGTDKNWGPYEYYKLFGLRDVEIGILVNGVQKRDYYYRSPYGSRLFDLGLGEFALAFVAASGEEDVSKIKGLQSEYGDGWIEQWLDYRRVGE
jgi:type IV secretion system protein VirB4